MRFPCVCLFSASTLLLAGRAALAEGPGCAASDLDKPFQGVPSGEVERITRAALEKLDSCKGRVDPEEEAKVLFRLTQLNKKLNDADLELCRRAAERGLHLDPKQVGYVARQIAEAWGRCGGDCSKTPLIDDCKKGDAKRTAEEQRRKTADAVVNLPVSCGMKTARKLIRTMDDAAFRLQALRYIAQYRTTCDKGLSSADAATLANDEAIVRFHDDDDAGCLKALTAAGDSPATAFNRALCGGPCSLEPAKCSAAAEARKKTVAGRPLRQALRERTKAFCWKCKPGRPCEVPPPEERPVWGLDLVAWDLKRTVQVSSKGKLETDHRIAWAGDLNADGIGDLVLLDHTIEPDMSSAALNGYSHGPTETWGIAVELGCGSPERYRNIWADSMRTEDDYAVESDRTGKSTIKSVCVRPEATPDHKATASSPRRCLDLSEWGKVEQGSQ